MAHLNGTIFFDAGCGLCSAGVRRWQKLVERNGFELVPLQDPRASQALGTDPADLPSEIKLQTRSGSVIGGPAAFAYVSRFIWWAFPLHLLMTVPLVQEIAEEVYKPIARNRRRISEACGLKPMMA